VPISASAVVQHLVALIKYAVVLVGVVLASKFLFSRDLCTVDSEDPGMRPAIGSTRTWIRYDRNAWTEADLEVGDIVVTYAERGENAQDSKGFPFRVAAVGGDWVKIESGTVVRYKDANDQQGRIENYPGAELRPYVNMKGIPRFEVPRGYVFLMNDNRVNAVAASPYLTPVSRVIGKIKL
jgi:hypothetical protein